MSQLLVGAGGWAYFQVPGTDSLEAYSQAFDLVELNSSYYHLPSISSASEWRKRVRDEFRFSVRCPRILVDHYGLNLLPGARLLIERLEEVCEKLEAEVMTILIGAGSPIKESELAARVRDFLGTFSSGGTAVALEFRGMRPSGEVFDFMKESGGIHSVDLSNSEPRYEGRVLYSRLFGKGEENIYEFDDRELKEIAKKASAPKFEKSILAFHGVRMYRDAGRVKSFIEKGYFPKITSGVGTESIREVLNEDARFPTTKSRLLKDQGWKVFQDTYEVRKISTVLEKLPEGEFNSLNDLMAELRSH
ncbi:MAG: hypothetical protein AUF79_17345 [Crenarchaeota archaeon 13_1_20CM_2_51_8]|nr:MAG: hypothetical protein AUF79_17345 [Crenarchaeota archaeon 13_1_20CM_2_51_8]